MEVQVVQGMSASAVNTMFFPEQDPVNQQWIAQQYERGRNMLTDAGKQFMNSVDSIYEKIKALDIDTVKRRITRAVIGAFSPNVIYPIVSSKGLQSAKELMQRYVMAMPDLRHLAMRQEINAYSDTYVDLDPNVVGEDHYDYRRVTNGVGMDVKIEVEGEEVEAFCTVTYIEDLREGDRELSMMEQDFIINSTWEAVRMCLKADIDPTDICAL